MERRKRKHKFKKEKVNLLGKINIFKILSILLIIIYILYIPAVIQKLVKITKIECVSQYGKCPQELELTIKNYESRDYLVAKKGLSELLRQNIQVNNYLIQYKIPSILKIELSLTKPKYAISDLSLNYYLIDKNDIVIEISKESNLPILINNVKYSTGQKISDNDKFALRLIEKVNMFNTTKSNTIEKNELRIITNDDLLVRLPLTGDIDVLIGSLRLIFSRLNDEANGIRMEDVQEIDLRFKNPVIR